MANIHRKSPQQVQQQQNALSMLREAVRSSLNEYEAVLKAKLNDIPRGSGSAVNEWDQTRASITEVRCAKRVLWMEDN